MNDKLPDEERNVDFEISPEGSESFQNFSAPKKDEFIGTSSTELKTPYSIAYMEKMKQKFPENTEGMRLILEEIDKQCIDSFQLFNSKKFPGTEISFIKLSVTPDLVRKIASSGNSAQNTSYDIEETRSEAAFLFTAMGMPPDGNAFTAEDMGIDRFIRSIPKVASALKQGRPSPNIDIYLLGSGTGYGEKVSDDFVQQVKEKGLDTRGEYYAELVDAMLEGKQVDHILLQGASMGAIAADSVYKHLPEDVQRKTQRLFDNPAGTHSPSLINRLRGAQAGVGLGAEFIVRETTSDLAKSMNKTRPGFVKYLFEHNNLPDDTPEETKNKNELFKAAGLKLLKGQPYDTSERTFVRQGSKDPLTFSPARFLRNTFRRGQEITTHHGDTAEIKVPMNQNNRTLEVSTKNAHMFAFENFARWNTIIDYCKSVPKN